MSPLDYGHLRLVRAAIAAVPDEAVDDVLVDEANRREDRRLARQRRGGNAPQPRCSVCKLFMARNALACGSCGYSEAHGFAA